MSTKLISLNSLFFCACFFLCFGCGVSFGQGGGAEPRPDTGGSTEQFETVDSNIDPNAASGSGGSTVSGTGDGVGELGSAVEFDEFEDMMIKGFKTKKPALGKRSSGNMEKSDRVTRGSVKR